jgi:hypothetical protein
MFLSGEKAAQHRAAMVRILFGVFLLLLPALAG